CGCSRCGSATANHSLWRRNMRSRALLALVAALALSACSQRANQADAAAQTGGNPTRGAAAISRYGCGSCHVIGGISGAQGRVGPPLTGVGGRMYIAGMLDNNTMNMVRWVRDPHAVNQNTVMPTLGVTPTDALDI